MRRRKHIRRAQDQEAGSYVDIHEATTVVLFTAVILFCVTDAIMTLFIIDMGGEEANPFMKYLMDRDIMMFFWVKFTITSLGMLFLVSHAYIKFYRVVKGKQVIVGVFAMYLSLIVYELVLLSHLA